MKIKVFNRTICILLVPILLGTNLFAQLALGPQRLISAPAPTLRNRTKLSEGISRRIGSRPRLSFVRGVGGVAFDSSAKPSDDIIVNNLKLSYSPSKTDGARLIVTINGRDLTTSIYDWQLIPIAKFANSDSYSCFTLFGRLNDPKSQIKVLKSGGRILNYHQDFVNTLMGLRLFQLDNLIINKYSYDLPKNRNGYLLGAGENPPDIEANREGLENFSRYRDLNIELFRKGTSYVISDSGRQVTFDLRNGILELRGEPSYYFWEFDQELYSRLGSKEALAESRGQVVREIQILERENPQTNKKLLFVQYFLREAKKFYAEIGDASILLRLTRLPELEALGVTDLMLLDNPILQKDLLNLFPLEIIEQQLITLRMVNNNLKARYVPDLSERVSNETAMLRAINPAVWDAGTIVMRYAAFFRYCKRNYPAQWKIFMAQINRSPKPSPLVTTPTIMEGEAPSSR